MGSELGSLTKPSLGQRAGAVAVPIMLVLLLLTPLAAVMNTSTQDENQVILEITFDRRLSGDRVGQHKVPPLTSVTMMITATVSSQVDNAILADYFSGDWTVVDANGGIVSIYDENYNKIEWDVGSVSDSVSRSYVVRSPQLTLPPTKYYFHSGLTWDGGSSVGGDWRVIVADPPDTETLYVDGFDSTYTDWTTSGDSPYLNDSDANYIYTKTDGDKHGEFSFANSGVGSGTINSVSIYFEAYEEAAGDEYFEIYVWDGSSWEIDDETITPTTTSYQWYSIDVGAKIDTWAKIDACEIYLVYQRKGGPTIQYIYIRRAYLYVDYTLVQWNLIETWTGTVEAPIAWRFIETWTGTVEAPVAWQLIETWTGTVEAPAAWQVVETWTGTVNAPAAWQVIETWTGTVEAPVVWRLIETWTGTVEAPAAWQLIEIWTGTVSAPAEWQLIETWTGTVNAPAEWGIVETWTGTVQAPVQWQVIETWTGTVNAPAVWQVIDSWTGTVQAPAAWQFIETWTGTVTAPAPPGKPALISPENTTQTDNTPTFTWTAGSYADNHRLLVDNDLGFSSLNENRIIPMPTTTYTIPPENSLLDDNYYWKVIAINELGENESDNWTFEVIAALLPGKPVLFAPENGTQTSDNTPTFEWVVGPNADNHRIEVDNEPTFSLPLVDNVVLGPLDNTWTAPGYAEGTYYWRVWAINEADYEVSENTWVIEIIPPAWYSIETWTGTVQAPAQWQLIESWTGTVSAPAEWQLIETWTGTVSAPVQWQVVETWTGTVSAPAIWQVVELWTGTISAPAVWQLVETWTGTVQAPAEWQLVESWTGTVQAPVGWNLIETWTGTVQAPTEWRLIETWTGSVSAPAEWYRIETWTGTVQAPAEWQPIETWTGAVSAPVVWQLIESWTGTVQAPAVWQVIETWIGTVEAPAAWQPIEIWTGTVGVPVPYPLLRSPPDGAYTNNNTPTFEWIPGSYAENHRLLVDNDPDFTSPEENRLLGATDTTYTPAPEDSLPDDNYSWKVIAIEALSENESVVWTFVIDTQAPSAPLLVSPADGTYTNDSTVSIDWDAATGASEYCVLVDNDADFLSITENSGWVTTADYTTTSLPDDNYSWKVYSRDEAGNENQDSSVWTFVVDTVPPVITSVLINNNAQTTSSTSVTIAIDASDATSGLAEMRFSDDNLSWSDWENFAASKPYTLPTGDGLKTVYVQVKDKAGLLSTVASDSITLETVPPPPEGALTATIGTITAGTTGSADFTQYAIAVTEVRITAAGTVSNVRVDVVVHATKPAGVTAVALPVYSYFDITTNIDAAEVSRATIEFQVPRSWIAQMKIDNRTIRLLRYSGGWQALSTSLVGADSTHFYYEATTPGFSVFAIVGERLVVPPPVTPPPTPPVTPIVPTPTQPLILFYTMLSMAGGIAGFAVAYRLLARPSRYYIMLKRLKRAVVRPGWRRVGEPAVRLPVRVRKPVSQAELAALRRLERIARERTALETVPPPPEGALTATIGTITAGTTGSADFTQYAIAVTEVRITAAGTVSNVRVDVVVHATKPAGVTAVALPVYSYFDITTNIDAAEVSRATIEFQVPRSWIAQNSIDERTVRLLRYDGGWQRLPTSLVGADSTHFYYEATTPGFSVFAIVGERRAEPPVVTPPTAPTPPPAPLPAPPAVPLEFFMLKRLERAAVRPRNRQAKGGVNQPFLRRLIKNSPSFLNSFAAEDWGA